MPFHARLCVNHTCDLTTTRNNKTKNQVTEISKVMGEKWKAISPEEKKVGVYVYMYDA